jgi:predicted DNA-binding protein with PD1-like motif
MDENNIKSTISSNIPVSINSSSSVHSSPMTAHVLRLLPESDLYVELISYLTRNNIKAACILSCVGSLKKIHIRTATGYDFLKIEDCFEIVSLVGSISIDRCHVHISISDKEGKTKGGHLMREGNVVFTTAEIVLGVMEQLTFSEVHCEKSGWPELKISENK